MRVHLRFTEKDVDLCRWSRSVKSGMLSYYISQIMLAEIDEKIAFIPNVMSVSANSDARDVTWRIYDEEIEQFLSHIPSYKRNGIIKGIIRKHLQAQGMLTASFSAPTEIRRPKVKEQNKVKKQPQKQSKPPTMQTKPAEEFVQTDEERDAIMALIAMGSE